MQSYFFALSQPVLFLRVEPVDVVDRVEAEEMFQKLESAREELEELKEEKENLLEANKKLVRVLVNMEDILQREGITID